MAKLNEKGGNSRRHQDPSDRKRDSSGWWPCWGEISCTAGEPLETLSLGRLISTRCWGIKACAKGGHQKSTALCRQKKERSWQSPLNYRLGSSGKSSVNHKKPKQDRERKGDTHH